MTLCRENGRNHTASRGCWQEWSLESSMIDALRTARFDYTSSLNGLKTLPPGRLKSRSFAVAIVSPWRRAVAAM